MTFPDRARLYETQQAAYDDSLDEESERCVPILIERSGGLLRGNAIDLAAGTAVAMLPGDNNYLKQIKYDLRGMYLTYKECGMTYLYQIMNVALGRAHLTDNAIQHVELQLQEILRDAGDI